MKLSPAAYRKSIRISLYLLGSLAFLALPIIFSPDLYNPRGIFHSPPFLRSFLTYVLLLVFFYVNYFKLIPAFFFTRKYLVYWSAVVLSLTIIIMVPIGILRPGPHPPFEPPHFMHHHHGPPPPGGYFFSPPFFHELGTHFFQFSIIVVLSLLVKISNKWKEAREAKALTELSYLKAQINPHFLFNTLNGIYALAIEKSDYTPTAVVKLSGMMRYVITDAGSEYIDLEKELTYLEDYIELQQMRFDNTLMLKFRISGEAKGKQIAPLIFLPFIENAFKYGISPEQQSPVKIEINITGEHIQLHVENDKVLTTVHDLEKTGIGINNVYNRLNLLYPGRYSLDIRDEAALYAVNLKLMF